MAHIDAICAAKVYFVRLNERSWAGLGMRGGSLIDLRLFIFVPRFLTALFTGGALWHAGLPS